MTLTLQAITEANHLLAEHAALILRVRLSQQSHRRELHAFDAPPILDILRLPLIPAPNSPSTTLESSKDDGGSPRDDNGDPYAEHDYDLENPDDEDDDFPIPPSPVVVRQDLPPAKRARLERYHNYVPEEETIRNDYSQRYVDSGEWPQNWVLGAEPEHRFEEYPKQQRLLKLKKESVNQFSLPPAYLPFSSLSSLINSKFDVILLDPQFNSEFTWDHLQDLQVPSMAGDPSFVFLWVGSGAGGGLEKGREVLAKWGYRRCEDIVWVKTNKTSNLGPGTDPPTTSVYTRTKQHCLMGIRGTVRRSTDGWFVHCNVDTDVIIWEGDPADPTRKPPEMYTLIENFCLGVRRLEIFGKPSSLRRGWVTVLAPGQDSHLTLSPSEGGGKGGVRVEGEEGGLATPWVRQAWEESIKELVNGEKPVVPNTSEIEALRPKSPVRGQSNNGNSNVNGSNGNGMLTKGSGVVGSNSVSLVAQPMAMNMGMTSPGHGVLPQRFANLNGNSNNHRGGGGGGFNGQNNPLMAQPMVGVGGMGNMAGGMSGMVGMGPMGGGAGMGHNMEELMGWNPMMNMNGMSMAMNINAMNAMNTNQHMNMRGMQQHSNRLPMGMNANLVNPLSGGVPLQLMGNNALGLAGVGGVGVGNPVGGFGGNMNMNNVNGWAGDPNQFGMDGWDESMPMPMMGMGMNLPAMMMGLGGQQQQQWSGGF